MTNSDAGKLQEDISTFTFRNKGSIRIPKSKREIAYIQAVDIIIDSISYTAYRSGKTEPDEGFYGYATLVFQDCLSEKIPLRFGRNRIYQERNEQALSQWEFHRQFYATKDYVDSFFRLLTEPDAPIPPFNPPKPLFVELPLRELYVECQENTQFQIEYTQWEPVPYVNDNSIPMDGKSQQQDGDKDNGLPENGSQPRQNPSNIPFGGNNPPSSQSQLGEFYNPKFGLNGSLSNLNEEGNEGAAPEGALTEQMRVNFFTTCTTGTPFAYTVYTEKFAYTGQGVELRKSGGTCVTSDGYGVYSLAMGRFLRLYYDVDMVYPWDTSPVVYHFGGEPSISYL